MIAREPSILSAFWISYVRPWGEVRERCICGCNTVIADGRLVYVQHDGLVLYLCFLKNGRAGASPLVERDTQKANSGSGRPVPPFPPSSQPRMRGLFHRVAKWWRNR